MEKCAEETDGNCTLPALKLGATMRALGENISDRDAMRLALQSSIIDSRGSLACLLACLRARARMGSTCAMCACECVFKRVCARTLANTVILFVCTRLCSCPHVLFFQVSKRTDSHANINAYRLSRMHSSKSYRSRALQQFRRFAGASC